MDITKRQSMSYGDAKDAILDPISGTLAGMEGTGKGDALAIEQALETPIGEKQITEATNTLNKYKAGKAALDRRIVSNEQWYKTRHWEQMRKSGDSTVEPSSAWMYNCIMQKHADMMDNYPEPNVLPREEQDKGEAELLSSIIPVVLEECDFEQTYDEGAMDFLKYGSMCVGVFWDAAKYNGLGDIDIPKINLLNIFPEPGVKNLQASKNLFTVELVDNQILEDRYPQVRGKLSTATVTPERFVQDENIDTSNMSSVIDWYYKKSVNGRTVVHYCKFVSNVVLYATENDREPRTDAYGNVVAPAPAKVGLYDDGRYPFVIIPFNENEGSPFGFGHIDIGKSAQEWIDRGNAALMKSMVVNANPRYMVRQDCDINEEDFADPEKPIIKYTGTNPNDAATPLQVQPVNSVYVNILQYKIEELKEVTGNREVSTGGAPSGITAASAIAALQETAGKGSRDINKKCYRGFREIVDMVIERIRQFYDVQRQFRIVGPSGMMRFEKYSNAHLKAQPVPAAFGGETGYRLPVMDIKVTAQKSSPYTKMSQNELALQLYKMGFFNPGNADNALAAVQMMDFDSKDDVEKMIIRNGTLYEQVQFLQQQLAMLLGNAPKEGAGSKGTGAPAAEDDKKTEEAVAQNNQLGGSEGTREATITKNARKRTAEAATPR